MSISSVGTSTAVNVVPPTVASVALGSATGGGVAAGVGSGSAGAEMVQKPGAKSLIAKVLGGAVVAAGATFGAHFLPFVGNSVPKTPVVLAAAAGVGALGGLVWHLLSRRKANLAMQAQQQTVMPPGNQPSTPTAAPKKGATLKRGSRGPATRTLQTQLKKLGLLTGKITGTYDSATIAAVRRYEVMKGVMPTGLGSPDLRAAVAQDVRLVARYG